MVFTDNKLLLFAKKHSQVLLLLCIIVLIVARAPNLLVHPRFWAEEGRLFFAYAYKNPWYLAVLKPHSGYLTILTNISTVLASLLPLKYAPFATTYTGFLVQLIPYLIILWGKSIFWDSPIKKALSCVIVMFAPAYSGELWLNTTCSHFHLLLIAFLILLEPTQNCSKFKQNVLLGLLLFSGFSSPSTVFLIPIYILIAILEKDKYRFRQTVVLFVCIIAQACALSYEIMQKGIVCNRFHGITRGSFVRYFVEYYLIFPIFGEYGIRYLNRFRFLSKAYLIGDAFHVIIAFIVSVLISITLFVRNTKFNEMGKIAIKTLGSCLIIVIINLNVRLVDIRGMGLRYVYPANIMLMFFIISVILYGKKFAKIICTVMISFSMLIGINQWLPTMKQYNYSDWPQWAREVEAWQKDHQRQIRIWPQKADASIGGEDWYIILSK